jgi:hypothetical protein
MSLLSLLPVFSLAFSGAPALAADCDVAALKTEATEGPPLAAARAFVQLGGCDGAAAAEVVDAVLPRLLSGDEASQAALKAIEVGKPAATVAYIDRLEADERARALKALGEACAESKPVQDFFVERAGSLGQDFWDQRWYRAIGKCNSEDLSGLLWDRIAAGPGSNRTQFSAVLEAWSRAAGRAGIPKLKGLLETVGDDAEAQVYVVAAFSDLAGVGSVDGVDADASAAAVAAVREVAPSLGVKGVEQARITLMSLGDEAASDELAAVRYKDAAQDDGTFIWGVAAVESATCKNGKPQTRITTAELRGRGMTWSDQLKDRAEGVIQHAWPLDLAAKCKGEGTVEVLVPTSPFADGAAFKAWAKERVEKAEPAEGKYIKIDGDPLGM